MECISGETQVNDSVVRTKTWQGVGTELLTEETMELLTEETMELLMEESMELLVVETMELVTAGDVEQ